MIIVVLTRSKGILPPSSTPFHYFSTTGGCISCRIAVNSALIWSLWELGYSQWGRSSRPVNGTLTHPQAGRDDLPH